MERGEQPKDENGGVGERGVDEAGRSFRRRGAIYCWLRNNYGFVERWLELKEPPWDEVARKLAAAEVIGAKGNAPAGHAVRRVWKRVARDVESARNKEEAEQAAREAKAEQRRNFPSRMSADRRWAGVQPERQTGSALAVVGSRQASPIVAASAAPKPWENPSLTPEESEHMQKQLERLEREEEWNSRNVRRISKERLAELKLEFGREEVMARLEAQKRREE